MTPNESFEEYYEDRKGYLHLMDRKFSLEEAFLKGYQTAINNMFGVLEEDLDAQEID